MSIKVRTFPAADYDKLEAKVNEILAKPESKGFELVTICPVTTSTGQVLLLIFQKP